MTFKFGEYDLASILMGLGLILAILGPFLNINLLWIFLLGVLGGLLRVFGKEKKDSVKFFLSAIVIMAGFGILGIVPGIPQVFSDMFRGITAVTFGAVIFPAIKTFVKK
jgi:peptidoglycan/LPS O-acetylase OafA/YrhL